MENMNGIEMNVANEVVENMDEVVETSTKGKSGMTFGKAMLASALTYGLIKIGARAVKKHRSKAKARKAKREAKKYNNDNVFDEPIEEIEIEGLDK